MARYEGMKKSDMAKAISRLSNDLYRQETDHEGLILSLMCAFDMCRTLSVAAITENNASHIPFYECDDDASTLTIGTEYGKVVFDYNDRICYCDDALMNILSDEIGAMLADNVFGVSINKPQNVGE
jgi:hypothetical protein